MPLREPLVRVVWRLPGAAVPDHDRAAAILALGDGALEFVVIDRVILDLHGEPLFARDKAWAARHRPALHHAVKLKPQIIVQARRVVLLDDEGVAALAGDLAFRFGGDAKVP